MSDDNHAPWVGIQYFKVPHELNHDPRLSAEERNLYCLLFEYCGAKDYCWPGISALCKRMHRTDAAVRRYLSSLKEKGWIQKKNRYGKSSYFWPLNPFVDVGDLRSGGVTIKEKANPSNGVNEMALNPTVKDSLQVLTEIMPPEKVQVIQSLIKHLRPGELVSAATQKQIEEETKLSRSTIYRYIKKFVKSGLLKKWRGPYETKQNFYQLHFPVKPSVGLPPNYVPHVKLEVKCLSLLGEGRDSDKGIELPGIRDRPHGMRGNQEPC